MDDLHKSLENTQQTIIFTRETIEISRRGGFRLHKGLSNSLEVLETIPESERAIQLVDFDKSDSPIQRTLGMKWNVREDCFVFICRPKEVIFTKRGVVSLVSSIFDPIGYLSPFTVRAKFIIQELWRSKLDWDSPLPEDLENRWKAWMI
jgi:hypothetical protein